MTPFEKELYQLTAFDLGDVVEIDQSGVIGEIVGMQIQIGREDQYLVSYHDHCGNPQRVLWPASSLDDADEDEPESNVIIFPTRH
jgi:hypothetical protein